MGLFGSVQAATGALVYGTIGAIGMLIPFTGGVAFRLLLLLGGAATTAWYLAPRRFRWLPSSLRQIRQDVAYAGYKGIAIYGVVLGVGVLTIVSTPLVWLGLAACLVASSAWWAACYGLMFGFGRWLQLCAHCVMGANDPEVVVLRTIRAQAGLTRVLGAGGGTALLALAWLSR